MLKKPSIDFSEKHYWIFGQAATIMEAFVEAFFDIDKDKRGEITKEELEKYMRQQNYEDAFVMVNLPLNCWHFVRIIIHNWLQKFS